MSGDTDAGFVDTRLGRLQAAVDMFLSGESTRERLAEVAAEIKAELELYDVLRDNPLQ